MGVFSMTYNYSDISLQEFPNEISLILYTGGCNLQCPWCFNPDLRNKKPLSFKQMKDTIDEHRDFITAVVFSGGEPLLNPYLKKTIQYAKSNGLKIKINTNGLVSKHVQKNWYLGFVDYINVSLKGGIVEYQSILKDKPFCNLTLASDILEYSFVYSPTIWPKPHLYVFSEFLRHQIKRDWHYLFRSDRWNKPDIFTVSQMQVGDCLDPQYNSCCVPTQQECIDAAYIFQDIPRKKLMVETKEFGRTIIK